MAINDFGIGDAFGFRSGAPLKKAADPDRGPKPLFPERPPLIAWNRSAPTGAIACAFRRYDDGSYRLESVIYFTAGESDGGECD
ncbi:hypothetical protein [Burkholderia gladioli]|uniref:hypothetical protein n=1 Tax=Burkholderia gladioli TaxID=28095 RepID=UPI00163DFB46|nr:hypothetical protein [Burkholderia gladioli]